jgi:phosphoribosylglycinamide formyltransferase-1
MARHRIAILVSGAGTNAMNIIEYFEQKETARATLVISNKKTALALKKAQKKGIKTVVFNNESFKKNGEVLKYLHSQSIDFIVLAGFLMKVPKEIIHAYPKKIVNIHPSLLPKFGGKGMYGRFVHEAVVEAKEIESGISIHYVSDEYDEGAIIFQSKVSIVSSDTAEDVAKKVQRLEHRHLPVTIERIINKTI